MIFLKIDSKRPSHGGSVFNNLSCFVQIKIKIILQKKNFKFLQGYFLLFESMLDTVLFARDKWLKPTGCGKFSIDF